MLPTFMHRVIHRMTLLEGRSLLAEVHLACRRLEGPWEDGGSTGGS